jgi:hypothetical protein
MTTLFHMAGVSARKFSAKGATISHSPRITAACRDVRGKQALAEYKVRLPFFGFSELYPALRSSSLGKAQSRCKLATSGAAP